jgi:catechol 2,3-dioxygenase-like lactoylglutathione lyase family enzyme
MTVLGIDTIAVVVSDPVKAIAWYRDVLGLDIAYIGPSQPNPDPIVQGTPDDPGHWIEIGPGGPRTRIHLCHMGGTTEPGPAGITFITDDIQKDHERLRHAGVEFPMPPEKMEWGEWLAQFVDPDENVFDLKQPISAREWKARPSPRKRRAPSRVRSASSAGSDRGRPVARGRSRRHARQSVGRALK